MAAYSRVYDSRHLQADCQQPGPAPEPYAQNSSMGYFTFTNLPLPLLILWDKVATQLMCGKKTDRFACKSFLITKVKK